MGVDLRPPAPIQPINWPTGEEVEVRRPNTYIARFWYKDVQPAFASGDPVQVLDALVKYAAMICPSKTEDQIAQECDEEFLVLLWGYANKRLAQAEEFLGELEGKGRGATAATAPAPPTPSGTSPAELPALAGVPCGT
jgi:hypothetical protein